MSSHLNRTQEMLKLLCKVNPKKNQKKNTEGLLVYLIQFLSSVAQNGKDRRGLNFEKKWAAFSSLNVKFKKKTDTILMWIAFPPKINLLFSSRLTRNVVVFASSTKFRFSTRYGLTTANLQGQCPFKNHIYLSYF